MFWNFQHLNFNSLEYVYERDHLPFFWKWECTFLFLATMNFSYIRQRARIALSCNHFLLIWNSDTLCTLRHWTTCKKPRDNPHRWSLLRKSHAGSTSAEVYLCFMNYKSNIYSWWKKSRHRSIHYRKWKCPALSPPSCLSHLAHTALLFLLTAYSQVSVSTEVFNQSLLWDS